MVKNDILFLLSGGLTNTNPNKSLGGDKSTKVIDAEIDNLFSDVTRLQAARGHTDYRCLYIVNNNPDEKLKDFSLYVHKGLTGAEVSLGLSLRSDVQALMVAGQPENGFFQLQYILKHNNTTSIQTTREINWVPDVNTMAQRIAAILNSLDYLSGVECVGSLNSAGYDFLITFGGTSSGRAQQLLGVVKQEGVSVTMMSVTPGGPINSIAPNIGQANNPPNGVTFYQTDNLTPVEIGTLMPGDFIPVWLKRVVPKQVQPVHPDQFRLHLFGEPVSVLQSNKVATFDVTPKKKSNLMHF